MPIIGVEFRKGVGKRPDLYVITLYTNDSCAPQWDYRVIGAKFDKKKVEFTPISGRNFKITSLPWRMTMPQERIHSIPMLRLIGKYSHSRHGADAFDVTELVFGNKPPITLEDLIDLEKSRKKTPYM
jgi:hypothetical protein